MESLLEILSDEPLPTLEIAKRIFGPDATTKQVNPLLYSLLARHDVEKITEENGSKPRWKLSRGYYIKSQILEYLSDSERSTQNICQDLKLSRRELEPLLNSLKKEQKIEKNETNWYLI